MADQAITALPKKTYSGSSKIAATDYLLGIDSAEGYQMLIQDLGEYIINKVTTNLAGSNQTLVAAISALNSKLLSTTGMALYLSTGTLAENIKSKCPSTCDVTFQCNSVWGQTDLPVSNTLVTVRVFRGSGSGNVHLEAYTIGGSIFHSHLQYNELTVSPLVWMQRPTRDEMDLALKGVKFSLSSGESKVVSGNVNYGAFLLSAQISGLGGYVEIINTTNNQITKRTMFSANDSGFTNGVTLAKANGTITITNNASGDGYFVLYRLDYYTI